MGFELLLHLERLWGVKIDLLHRLLTPGTCPELHLPGAPAAGHKQSRKRAGTGPGTRKSGWEIHSAGKNELGELLPPLKSPRAHSQVPWCPPTHSLHHQAEFLLPPGLLQPAAPGMSPLGPWQRLGRGLLRAHRDRPLIPNSQRGQRAGQSEWRDTRQPGASAWIVTRGSNSGCGKRKSKGLIWKGKCEALAPRRNIWLGELLALSSRPQ